MGGLILRGSLSVRFSSDGRRFLACNGDAGVRIWDIATGLEEYALRGHSSVCLPHFSHD